MRAMYYTTYIVTPYYRESTALFKCMYSTQQAPVSVALDVGGMVKAIWDAIDNSGNRSNNKKHAYLYCSSLASVSTDTSMKHYVHYLVESWAQGTLSSMYHMSASHSAEPGEESADLGLATGIGSGLDVYNTEQSKFQLGKYGYSTEDCVNIHEQLATLYERYANTDIYDM